MEERQFTVRDPNTFTSFDEVCEIVEAGAETEMSPEKGMIIVKRDGDQQRYSKRFNVTREDRTKLADRIKAFLMRGRRKNEMSVFDRQSYAQEGTELYRVIEAYAHCLPREAKDSFDAFCDNCQEPRKISISDKEVFVDCPECRAPFRQ
jgi:hypothetical protein